MAKVTAVVDIGSNSARMAVYNRTSRYGFHLLKEYKSRVRISENAWKNGGVLQQAAIDRAIAAISGFVQIAKSYGARKIIVVATSAMRDAPNRSDVVAQIKSATGVRVRVITGEEEADLVGVAAANLLPLSSAIAIDIGGGSTEVVLIENSRVVDKVSFNLGTVRLKELFFDEEKPNFRGAIRFIGDALDTLPPHFKNKEVIGVGGTLRALASVLMKEEKHGLNIIHAYRFSIEHNKDFLSKVIRADYEELRRIGFKNERLDVAREGVLIFSKVAKKIGATDAIISGAGVREGAFLKQMFRVAPDGFSPSVTSLVDRFGIVKAQSDWFCKTTMDIFDVLQPLHGLDGQSKRMLYYAAKLSNIGSHIDPFDKSTHGSYIALNGLNYGFEQHERVGISILIGASQKRDISSYEPPSEYKNLLPSVSTLRWLVFILQLTGAIGASRSMPKITLDLIDEKLTIGFSGSEYLAKEEISKLKPIFNLELSTR